MAIMPMQKVAVLAHHASREALLEQLQRMGVIEVTESKEPSAIDHTEVNFRAAELQFAIDTLKDVAGKDIIAQSAKPSMPADVLSAAQKTDVRGIVDRLHSLEEEDTAMQRSLEETMQRVAILQPWRGLSMRLDSPAKTLHTEILLGILPDSKVDAVQELARSDRYHLHCETLTPTPEGVPCMAVVWSNDRLAFEEEATARGWTTVHLPRLEGTPRENLDADLLQQTRLRAALEKNRRARVALSRELPALFNVRTFLRWLSDKQSVREALVERFATVTLLGWIPKNRLAELEHSLENVSPAIAVLRVKPSEGEEPPVYLKNSSLVTPFESVTTLYGLPLPTEMDPTGPLAPFFALYFALCLTDGGYGLALTIIFGTWLLWKRPALKDATLPWLLFFSGIASVLVGIPFGGWFGLMPNQVPAFLTTVDAEGSMWFLGQMWNLSTQEGINFLQYLSLTLGIVHMFYGIFLAGWFKWVHGAKADAFWQHFTTHLLLGSVLVFAFAPAAVKPVALWVLYASLALVIWVKGYGSAWYVRPILGLLGFLNFAIGLLSNGLSYLRNLALGLVTGAIALAVNQVAIEMSKLFPLWLAIPVMILIAFGGHLVSIALNTLGAFIHSGRLQFIEFFGQFFEGGGRPFSPFRRSNS